MLKINWFHNYFNLDILNQTSKLQELINTTKNTNNINSKIELQEKDLALRAQKMMNDLKVHEDKMALEEAQTIIKDENTDYIKY